MKHEVQIESEVPKWLKPSEARERLDLKIDRFIRAVAEQTAEPDAALALKVTAGLGKTATTLRVIARYAETLLSRGHVLVYVPTLDLAERALEDFRQLAPGTPCRVVRGRDAVWPDNREKQMCARADLVKMISGFVPSVTQALCRGPDQDGNFVQSDCADGCPYLCQKDIKGSHVVFLSHAYLTVHPPIDSQVNIALRVIDEKFWQSLVSKSHISVDDFMRVPPKGFPSHLRGTLTTAKAAVIDGLQRNLPLHDHLASLEITGEQLSCLAEAEQKSRVRLEIGPWQSLKTVNYCVMTFDTKGFIASRRREKIFNVLGEKPTGHCNGIMLGEKLRDASTQQWIELTSLNVIPRDAPVLLLDADADPELTKRIVPGAAFVTIESPPVADIVQVSDLTLSNDWLLDDNQGLARRAGVLEIIRREVAAAAGRGVLLVATKSVLEALHGDVGQHVPSGNDEKLRQPLMGTDPRWFGPRMQGVNDYSEYAAAVIVGRLQPGITDVEASARAVFGKDDKPISSHVQGALPAIKTSRLMADGTMNSAVGRNHPDQRVQSILAQTRECGTLQVIARLRLVSPSRKKRVVILSNLPLPGFPVTRSVSFEALQRGLEDEPDCPGFVRMQKAMRATMGQSVRGTRLSADGLANDLPLDFKEVARAKRFRRGRPTADLLALCQRVAKANGWPITACNLRRASGGKAVTAIMLAPRHLAQSQAQMLWPEFNPEIV